MARSLTLPGTRARRVRTAGCAATALMAAALAAGTPAESPGAVRVRGDTAGVLRVCADPNNLPFSNARGQGFENALAGLVAREMGRRLEYTWWAQRRGFIRNTLSAGKCDVVMGVPSAFDLAWTTDAYYRSTYVFVSRRDRHLAVSSFDDPRLKELTIGVHVIGDDYASVPPSRALAARGIIRNIRGYSIYGDYSKPDPPRGLIDAVAAGEVDVAVAWGPLAGYFAPREPTPLDVVPVRPGPQPADATMAFDISMGVRKGDAALRSRLNGIIRRRRSEIRAILERFGVPIEEAVTLTSPPRPSTLAPTASGTASPDRRSARRAGLPAFRCARPAGTAGRGTA